MSRFITFEGGEGSGKTTQSKKLFEYLKSRGFSVIWTREIGGTEIAEKIRDIVVNNEILPQAELLLIMAARYEHVEKVIKPALEQGSYVICDRFIDSTAAYQANDEEQIKRIFYLNRILLDNFLPDKTIYMRIDPQIALERAIKRGDTNKYEEKGLEFHHKIAKNYEFLASSFSYRIKSIEAKTNEEEIFQAIIKSLNL